MTEQFFPVPGFPRYEINRSGELRDTKTGKTKTWYRQEPIAKMGGRIRNMKRGYLIARVIDDHGTKRHIFQHRVIAMLFVPCPGDPADYVVNHLDGDGSNNVPKNLEWVTYSQNMLHAYETGLCSRTRGVLVRDSLTGTVEEFRSIAECARRFQLPHATLKNRLVYNAGKVFDDGFAFKFTDDPSDWSTARVRTVKPKAVFAFDLINHKLWVAGDQKELSRLVNVTDGNINAALRKGTWLPINGFVFGWSDQAGDLPRYTSWQIELYKRPRKRSDQPGWLETNVETGKQQLLLINELAERLNLSISRATVVAKKGKSPCGVFRYELISPYPNNERPLSEQSDSDKTSNCWKPLKLPNHCEAKAEAMV